MNKKSAVCSVLAAAFAVSLASGISPERAVIQKNYSTMGRAVQTLRFNLIADLLDPKFSLKNNVTHKTVNKSEFMSSLKKDIAGARTAYWNQMIESYSGTSHSATVSKTSILTVIKGAPGQKRAQSTNTVEKVNDYWIHGKSGWKLMSSRVLTSKTVNGKPKPVRSKNPMGGQIHIGRVLESIPRTGPQKAPARWAL